MGKKITKEEKQQEMKRSTKLLVELESLLPEGENQRVLLTACTVLLGMVMGRCMKKSYNEDSKQYESIFETLIKISTIERKESHEYVQYFSND